MNIRIAVISALLLLTVVSQASNFSCHYSCQECVGPSYTLCSKCLDGKELTVVEDPALSQPQHINSNKQSGVCISEQSAQASALGIILLIACSAVVAVVRTPTSVYLFSILQTLSLLSFVEVAWLNPVGYLLQSLQYFMIFGWLGSGYKLQDQTMRQRQYYRLDLFMRQSNFLSNFAIIGIIDLLVFVLMACLAFWKHEKDQKQKQARTELNSEKSEKIGMQISESDISHSPESRPPKPLLHTVLQTALKALLTTFFLLIQESTLTIYTGLRFESPLSVASKAIPIVYCLMLLAFMGYLYMEPLWVFPNKFSQFIGIWRKITLPLLAVVPYSLTFLIILGMLVFAVVESVFDYRGGRSKLLSRLTFFKIAEIVVIILAGAYLLTELNINLLLQTSIIRVFLAVAIVAMCLCIVVELVMGIFETYIQRSAVNNNAEVSGQDTKILGDTFQGLDNADQTLNDINNNIFNTEPGGERQHKNVMVYDMEDQIDPPMPVRDYKDDLQGKEPVNDEHNIRRSENREDKGLRVSVTRKENTLKASNLSHDKHVADQADFIPEISAPNQQKSATTDQPDQVKLEELLVKETADDEKLRAKQNKQKEQAEQKARKKRRYMAQMDPQLRKRYGF